MFWMTLWWPSLKVTTVTMINKNLLVCRIENHSTKHYKTWQLYPSGLVMLITWLAFGWIPLKTHFCHIFLEHFGFVFFKVKDPIGHISGMVGPTHVKRKGGVLVGYWVKYVTLIFDFTHNLDLWFRKGWFENSCIAGIVIWLMWNKMKANQLDTGLTVWFRTVTTAMTLNL